MRFALLETTPLIEQLESQIARGNEHQVVFSLSDLNQLDLRLLEQTGAQVVVLGGPQEEAVLLRAVEALKAFRGTVCLAHPCTRAVLTAYEVERLAGDALGHFVPLLPLLHHPVIQEALTASMAEPLIDVGRVERVEMQRPIQFDQAEAVFDIFAQDLTALVALAGSITEVVAMQSGSETVPLNIQCTTQTGRLVRWSAVRPSSNQEPAQLLIEGTEGRATVRLNEIGEGDVATVSGVQSFPPFDLAAIAAASPHEAASAVDWQPMTHSLEVREAAQKSVNRGRLVRLNLDGHGEKTAFKGTMASLGCGLLIGGLVLLVLSAIMLNVADASGFEILAGWINKVPWVLAGLMVIFLLIQTLAYVIPRSDEK